MNNNPTLASQLRADFKRDNQTFSDFMAEMKLLSDTDKKDYIRLYKDAGIAIKE